MQIIEKNINTGETIVRLNKEEIKILESLENDTTRFGIKIKAILKQRNMTQRELATRTGISVTTISFYINAHRTPNADRIRTIARVLGVETKELFNGIELEEIL